MFLPSSWPGAVAVLASITSATIASGQPASASGSLGGGVVGGEPAAVVGAEVDLEGWGAALGLGMRLRFVNDEPLAEDWNERSDIGRVLRYFLWSDEIGADGAISMAAGQLAGVELGHGSIISGYAAGVDFDRGRAGLEARFRRAEVGGHLLVDDVLDPELFGARLSFAASENLSLAVSSALDLAAGDERLVAVATDASLEGRRGWALGAVYADAVAIAGLGGGLHLGARSEAVLESGVSLSVRGELRAGTDRYIPGWIGPLYVRDRIQAGDDMTAGSQLDRARSGAHGGLSWAAAIAASHPAIGSARARLETRPGLPPIATLHAMVPSFRDFQLGAWAAVEGGNGAALAAELRVRLPRSLFAAIEVARHYSRRLATEIDELSPLWVAAVSLGATLGER